MLVLLDFGSEMIYRIGVMDVVSISALWDTCLVLPTLRHAAALWPNYQKLVTELHDKAKGTKTAVAMLDTHTVLRLWVPYTREPTMVMDEEPQRKGFELVTPYGKGEL